MFHQENDDTGGEHLDSEVPLDFSDDDHETNSSTYEYDDMSSNVHVYHIRGLDSEAFRLGVGAENMIRGDVEMYVGMRERSETEVEGMEEIDGWGSIEESHGGHASVLGGRNIDLWIPDLVETVSALYLQQQWEDRNIQGWRHDGVDDGYYIGEYDMVIDDYLLESGAYGTPAALSAVEDLASWVITQENDHVKCTVCLEEFKVGDMTKVLPCSHYYHEGCIIHWLEMHNTCPVCRFQLPIDDPEYEGEGNEVVAPHE
ncbi:uncharacterized protein LOC141714836 [Apium graveolens]|uniref:uncharacterized protein LOC141714836 n=1 Tax=Apium graveolens TaxID=4045 RepID=UPI003D78C88F